MSNDTEELIRICEALPRDKRSEVADFARFLLAQADETRWERLIAHEQSRPKLEAFVREAVAEGTEPLDPDRL
ncbi:MAG: hypothetical protein ACR2FX_07300 [Chthoniobacterales bacterium]